jgi:hypothetical protein
MIGNFLVLLSTVFYIFIIIHFLCFNKILFIIFNNKNILFFMVSFFTTIGIVYGIFGSNTVFSIWLI